MLEYLAGRFQLRSTGGREETACAGSIRGFAALGPSPSLNCSSASTQQMEDGFCLRVAGTVQHLLTSSSLDLQPTFLAPRVSHCRTALPRNPQKPRRPVLRTPLRPTGEETEARGVGECRSAPSPGPLLVLSRFPALHVDLSALVFLTKGPRVTALPAGAVLERRVPGLTRQVGRLGPTDGEKRVPGCVGPRYRREVRAEPV